MEDTKTTVLDAVTKVKYLDKLLDKLQHNVESLTDYDYEQISEELSNYKRTIEKLTVSSGGEVVI